MHLYNAWLPPPVVEEIQGEEGVLGEVVLKLQRAWNPDNPRSKFSTLKWISLINNLIKSKTVLSNDDLDAVVRIGFDVFFHSSENLFVQVRWATCLSKILRKYHKKLTLKVEWRKLYDMMLMIHFKRRDFYEGIALKQIHLEAIVLLILHCRRFFTPGSASEIWSKFRPFLDDTVHNSCLEALGFLALFFPTTPVEPDVHMFNIDWLRECLQLWGGVTDCPFWDRQWAYIISHFIKHRAYTYPIDFTPVLPQLFRHFLNMFEVPVAKSDALPPIEREVPYDLKLAFNGSWMSSSKSVAKAIMYLIQPDGLAQGRLEQLVDLLEQYYHPSNGGSWTSSLEQFLRHLSFFFLKRLSYEEKYAGNPCEDIKPDKFLGSNERDAFVKTIVRLVERAQYSKNTRLAVTASNVASGLAFVSPSVILPFLVSRFEAAMLTVTATHQLESALTTLALASRAIFLASAVENSSDSSTRMQLEQERLDFSFDSSFADCKAAIVEAMFSTLLGLDANDPPKTLATLQFYCSVISNVGIVGDYSDSILPLDWSQWLDEFLSRLFVLLRHSDSSSHSGDINLGEGSHKSSSTFLMQEESLFSTLIEILFGRLTVPLFQQALKKVARFVHGNILPGAVTEVGLLCSALVYANPVDTCGQVLVPIIKSVLSTLNDSQNLVGSSTRKTETQANLSPATEVSVSTQVTLLSLVIMNAGSSLLQCRDDLQAVVSLCFSFSSVKVSEAGERLLSSLLESLLLYYPRKQYTPCVSYPGVEGLEEWTGTKDSAALKSGPDWHIPVKEEVEFAEQVLTQHLKNALAELQLLWELNDMKDSSVQVKDKLRLLLQRITGSLRGVRSCLPDFDQSGPKSSSRRLGITGKTGASAGSAQLREETSEILIKACEYLLKAQADDTTLLVLLVQALDLVGNHGSTEYNEWSNGKHTWRMDSKSLVEPRVNYITGVHYLQKRRPRWMMIEMVYLQNLWRASQAGYRQFEHSEVPPQIEKVAMELLKLSLHNYSEVRIHAGSSLKRMLKRFPPLVKTCMPVLTASLQDPQSPEHSALGACAVLSSRPILRHIAQDWSSLAKFMLAVLGSSHHGTVKAQTAISELAIAFSVRVGGVPLSSTTFEGNDDTPSHSQLLQRIKELSQGHSGAVHWRYKLMAHVGLLCLVLPPEDPENPSNNKSIVESRKFLTGEFLSGIGSDLPPLRPLSVIGLLLLLHKGSGTNTSDSACSVEHVVAGALQGPGYSESVVKNLSLDHHYSSEGQGSSRHQNSDMSVTNMMPAFVRQWPTTRNWVLATKGDAFSPKFAKLFKRLVQECGPVALEALRGPLQRAVEVSEERSMQCIAAEVIAGVLHSDVPCVGDAWDEWLGEVFYKGTMQANVESLSEWAACVRFAVTGKGRRGTRAPVMRQRVLDSLMRPLPASAATSLVSKRLQYLLAGVSDLRATPGSSVEEIKLQVRLLEEVLGYMSQGSSQVRQSVGKILCAVCTNLQDAKVTSVDGKDVPDWNKILLDGTQAATAKIQKSQEKLQASEAGDSVEASANGNNLETVKYMETVLQFIIAAFASGRSPKLMAVLVGVLPSTLSLQETSHKDMSALAKLAVYLYKWLHFHGEFRAQAVAGLISAANDSNWRTRTAALTFLQSFIYRHTFSFDSKDVSSLWECVQSLLSDPQLEVREVASTTFSGMLKGLVSDLPATFRANILSSAGKAKSKSNNRAPSDNKLYKHGIVMGLRACILSAPYDIPRWLPDMIVSLAKFTQEPSPISKTVTRTIAEFRRTHADTWAYQKSFFSEEQLEVLSDLSSSATYFA